ncbi:MAG: pyrroloquinoline quinone biosynthesis protein PqqB [Gemmatimonadaceae bacterium]|nr:pyrroloquinoline quinone biosynthesis protein PqqB [Acetobacteraceae bacterium]
MRAIVLGSAAGGAFPQWNSNAPGCRRARAGEQAARARTQASLAVSAGRNHWILLNASPDLRQQIEQTPELQPSSGLRSSPIAAVVLTGGDVDVIAGLLTLRERQSLTVIATSRVHAVLDANPIFEVLARDIVARAPVALDVPFPIPLPCGDTSGLVVTLFAVPGKVPLYLEQPGIAPSLEENDQTVGAEVTDGASTLFYIPGCAAMTAGLADRLRGAEAVFFDGTLWSDDEMVRAGLGPKTGRRMGHMSVSGPDGTMAAFAPLGVQRRILLHINNSNPILLDDSPERALVAAAGWDVAYDGMELTL